MSSTTRWQKSSFSGGGDGNNCLELAIRFAGPALRESDDLATVLATTRARLMALLTAVKSGGAVGPHPLREAAEVGAAEEIRWSVVRGGGSMGPGGKIVLSVAAADDAAATDAS